MARVCMARIARDFKSTSRQLQARSNVIQPRLPPSTGADLVRHSFMKDRTIVCFTAAFIILCVGLDKYEIIQCSIEIGDYPSTNTSFSVPRGLLMGETRREAAKMPLRLPHHRPKAEWVLRNWNCDEPLTKRAALTKCQNLKASIIKLISSSFRRALLSAIEWNCSLP